MRWMIASGLSAPRPSDPVSIFAPVDSLINWSRRSCALASTGRSAISRTASAAILKTGFFIECPFIWVEVYNSNGLFASMQVSVLIFVMVRMTFKHLCPLFILLILSGCGSVTPPCAPPSSGDVVYVVGQGWHAEIGIPVQEFDKNMSFYHKVFAGARVIMFGYGKR